MGQGGEKDLNILFTKEDIQLAYVCENMLNIVSMKNNIITTLNPSEWLKLNNNSKC